MCDYSLHHLRSRPAKVGDKLTVSDFGHPLRTRGFAAPEDEYLAVCLLPGTELSFANEVRRENSWVPFNCRLRVALCCGNRENKLLDEKLHRINVETPPKQCTVSASPCERPK